jgi:peroxiredoxin
MPGAFTPTCSKQHLPGYVAAASDFAKLGYTKIAALTTNDHFVNEEWATASAANDASSAVSSSMPISLLSDADGDYLKAIGLADDMGFGVGVRSKRFAMVLDTGVVTHLLTDEGMDECSATAAANLLSVLTPPPDEVEGEEMGEMVLVGGAVAVGAALLLALSSLDGSPTPPPTQQNTPKERVQNVQPKKRASESTRFSLLDQYAARP